MLKGLAIAALLLIAGLAPAAAQTALKPADLAREFEEVGFVAPLDGSTPVFVRAAQPLDIHVAAIGGKSPAVEEMKATVQKVAATLRQAAGVKIRIKASGGQPFGMFGIREQHFKAMAAIFGREDPSYQTSFAFAQGIKKQGCFLRSGSNEQGLIVGGNIIVDIDRPEPARARCITNGLLFMLGLMGETRAPTGVFTSVDRVRGLTARDLAIVRMAMDPRLKPGMTLAEARPLLPAIAADALAAR